MTLRLNAMMGIAGALVALSGMLAGRGNGPHPYEMTADWVQRYFKVAESCARAAQLRLEQQIAGK